MCFATENAVAAHSLRVPALNEKFSQNYVTTYSENLCFHSCHIITHPGSKAMALTDILC